MKNKKPDIKVEIKDKDVFVTINGNKAQEIDSDGTRLIFEADGIIVKVDYIYNPDNKFYNQSNQEIGFYQKIDPCDRFFFVEPIAWGDRWIAQRKVNIDRTFNTFDWSNIQRVAIKYKLMDISYNQGAGGMIYSWNWGIDKDTNMAVIYDYGIYEKP